MFRSCSSRPPRSLSDQAKLSDRPSSNPPPPTQSSRADGIRYTLQYMAVGILTEIDFVQIHLVASSSFLWSGYHAFALTS